MAKVMGVPLTRIGLAANSFTKQRADYYEYLADLMQDIGGGKTLRRIFEDDASRYGKLNPRGVLSEYWARRYDEVGGDLADVFAGTLPDDEVALIGKGQKAGAGALEQSLRDIAVVSRLLTQVRNDFKTTLAAGFIAVLAVIVMLLGVIPYFTVPMLQVTFRQVPHDLLGKKTQALFNYAAGVNSHLLWIALAVVAFIYAIVWSLPNYVGPGRRRLDNWFLWRIYRDFEGIKFLAAVATLVKQRANVSTQLREAIEMQLDGAAPWKRWHVQHMLSRIDQGIVGADTFDTGVLDKQTLWGLTDLISTLGVDQGLQRTRYRIETRVVKQLAKKATIVRWILLGMAVATMGGIYAWHMAVVFEMKSAFLNSVAH